MANKKDNGKRGIRMVGVPLFALGFLLFGMDRLFGWPSMPFEAVFVAAFAIRS